MRFAAGLAALLALVAGLVSLGRIATYSSAYDFSAYYFGGVLAAEGTPEGVYERVPDARFEVPPDGAMARAADARGYAGTPVPTWVVWTNRPVLLGLLGAVAVDHGRLLDALGRAAPALPLASALVAFGWLLLVARARPPSRQT